MPGRCMELGGVRSIKGLDLVPRTPRIGEGSKPRLGHSAGFCLAAYDGNSGRYSRCGRATRLLASSPHSQM
jgi:hypothetical protein